MVLFFRILPLRKFISGNNKSKDTSKSAINMDLTERTRLVQAKLFTCHYFLHKKT